MRVLDRIKRHAEPFEDLCTICPDAGGMFIGPGAKTGDHRDLAGGSKHSDLQRNPVDKIVDGEDGAKSVLF